MLCCFKRRPACVVRIAYMRVTITAITERRLTSSLSGIGFCIVNILPSYSLQLAKDFEAYRIPRIQAGGTSEIVNIIITTAETSIVSRGISF